MNAAKKSQILIVDDYPTNIKVLSDLLIEYGFEVLIARDGENALQKLQRISPDLILLDVLMPGIDGFETCRQLKARELTRNIPVIFMTALADPVDKIKGLTLGAVDYITKPFQQEEVLARVNSHLKLRYLTRQLEEQNAQLQEEARSRQIAEAALRFSEEKFAKAFRSNPGAMVILTLAEGRIIETNHNFCRITGYAPEAVLGKTLEDLRLCPEEKEPDRWLDRLRQDRGIHNQECCIQTCLGEMRYLLFSAEVINVRDLPCILAMAVDVTEGKRSAVALQRAKAAAELANQAKSQFLANISHELRTPLSTILGCTQLMGRDSTLGAELQEHLGNIRASSEHLLTLINDVLEMTKIESGQLTLHETSFDLYALLDALQAMMEPKVQAKGLHLSVERADALPRYIRTDETKLRQVLINLVGNSIKFTQMGQVVLRVVAAPAADGVAAPKKSLSLRFEVEDTGPGIATDELELLFEPFIQTEVGRQSQEGTGLGLPISQRFVQLMGGEIQVRSTQGIGSCFSFAIVVQRATTAVPGSRRRVVGLAENQPVYRLLVVEDQAVNRQLLVKLLSGVGFEVREATNGEDAIAQTQDWHPHLIWMDVRMPRMDGYEATRQIKQKVGPVPKIIALTANAFEEERVAALTAGCDDFVRKPIQEEVLFGKMAEHLGVVYRYQNLSSPSQEISPPEITQPQLPTLLQSVREELWGLVDGDEAFLADYLSAHLEHLPQIMRSLRQASAQQEPEALSLAAHTLKGMGLTFGAQQFTELCLAVEQAAKAGTSAVPQDRLEQLDHELNWLMAAIRQELQRLPSSP